MTFSVLDVFSKNVVRNVQKHTSRTGTGMEASSQAGSQPGLHGAWCQASGRAGEVGLLNAGITAVTFFCLVTNTKQPSPRYQLPGPSTGPFCNAQVSAYS